MLEDAETEGAFTRFAVIVAVYHSLDYLSDCLASLEKLNYPVEDFQVVVLDLDTIEGLREFMEKFERNHLRIAYFHPAGQTAPQSSLLNEVHLNRSRNLAVMKFPADIYAFTEDDCTFEPDWLVKIEAALAEGVGSVGGPDLLPPNMGWFPTALDRILDSPLGRVGAKGGGGKVNFWYFPRKENMAVPAWVFDKLGQFREDRIFGVEMEFARLVRDAGLKTVYLADNPVWHKRNTTILKLLLRNYYMAEDKVQLMRETGSFKKSFHFLILILTITLGIIGLSALFSPTAQLIFLILLAGYLSLLLSFSVSSAGYTGRKSVGFGLFLLTPLHHLSIVAGIFKGVLTKSEKKI